MNSKDIPTYNFYIYRIKAGIRYYFQESVYGIVYATMNKRNAWSAKFRFDAEEKIRDFHGAGGPWYIEKSMPPESLSDYNKIQSE